MSMVTSPQGSVQPVELEFTFRGIAWRLTSLEETLLFDGLLPPHEGNSSMLDYGKISNSMTSKLPSWERCGQAATDPRRASVYCLVFNRILKSGTLHVLNFVTPNFPTAYRIISVGK